MDAGRLRALVIGGTVAATLAVGGVVAADPVPEAPPAPPADPVMAALEALESRAARDLAQAEGAVRNRPAPIVVVTQAPAVTQSTSS